MPNQYYGYQPYYRQEVIRVNGKSGADMYQLAPNSSALLLDETQPIVWLVQTDGAGYKVSTPYSISPFETPQPKNPLSEIEERLTRLEEKLNEPNTTKTARKSATPAE